MPGIYYEYGQVTAAKFREFIFIVPCQGRHKFIYRYLPASNNLTKIYISS